MAALKNITQPGHPELLFIERSRTSSDWKANDFTQEGFF